MMSSFARGLVVKITGFDSLLGYTEYSSSEFTINCWSCSKHVISISDIRQCQPIIDSSCPGIIVNMLPCTTDHHHFDNLKAHGSGIYSPCDFLHIIINLFSM